MPKTRTRKLALHRETLRLLERTGLGDKGGDTSCLDSCYFVSCGGDCQISTGAAAD